MVKTLIKSKETNYLTSGSKNTSDRINLTDNPEIIIWGVVTYVIQTAVKKLPLIDCNSFYVSCERLFNPKYKMYQSWYYLIMMDV